MKALQVMKAVAWATYKEWAAYRSHMLVTLFVGPVFFLVQMFIWKAIYSSRETVNGLSLEQMLAYYGISAVINYLVFDFADWNLQMLIRTGRFLTFMLRPVSHRYFALSQKLGHRLLGLWLEFIPVYVLFTLLFRIRLVPANLLWALLSTTLSFLVIFLTNYCIGITAFWLTRADGVRRIFLLLRDLCSGMFIPLNFFPLPVQQVLFFLPFQFAKYVPVRVFIGSYELAGRSYSIPYIVLIQAFAVLSMFFVSEALWRLGIKRFTGVGA